MVASHYAPAKFPTGSYISHRQCEKWVHVGLTSCRTQTSGALTLDGLFLPHSGDTKVDCISLEITSFGAAVFVGSMMLMFRKSIYVFAGIIFGEIAGGEYICLCTIRIVGSYSPGDGDTMNHTPLGLSAMC
eukprot:scaffold17883_cov36-Tisochrysis_lutea.AAC.3